MHDLAGPPHSVISSEIEVGEDGVWYVIQTTHGVWRFRGHDRLTFPRRLDGSVKNWFALNEEPYVTDLAVGDILPPWEPHPDENPAYAAFPDRSNLIATWQRQYQEVTAIFTQGNPNIIHVSTIRPWDNERRKYQFLIAAKIRFPYQQPSFGPSREFRPRGTAGGPYKAYGPYKWKVDDGTWLYLAEHPTGRGRWPKVFNDGGITLSKNFHVRMIRPQGLWSSEDTEVYFAGDSGYDRHPKDPRWGRPAEISPAPSLISNVYQHYLNPGAVSYEGDEIGLDEHLERMHDGRPVKPVNVRDIVARRQAGGSEG